MAGFMTATSLLSMWISNTATSAMMIPVMEVVLEELGEIERRSRGGGGGGGDHEDKKYKIRKLQQ